MLIYIAINILSACNQPLKRSRMDRVRSYKHTNTVHIRNAPLYEVAICNLQGSTSNGTLNCSDWRTNKSGLLITRCYWQRKSAVELMAGVCVLDYFIFNTEENDVFQSLLHEWFCVTFITDFLRLTMWLIHESA